MKKSLLFTILLLSSWAQSIACGYYPCGEDIRYSLFKPKYFNYKAYQYFYYNADLFGYDSYYYNDDSDTFDLHNSNLIAANELDWFHYVGQKVPLSAINLFLNNAVYSDMHQNSRFEFLNYLYQHRNYDAIRYLIAAKQCEQLTTLNQDSDPWERAQPANDVKKNQILNQLIQLTNKCKDKKFQRKYAFLTIRLAHYAGKQALINSFFETYFQNKTKDYLYYWSSYFYGFDTDKKDYMNYIAALTEHCPEKFYASYYYFHDRFHLDKALQFAKTNEDRANLYGYASLQNLGPNLEYLKQLYHYNPKSKLLAFLLLREVNKIEDWVYTPYYSNFEPSVESSGTYYGDSENRSTSITLRARSEKDRLYAQQVLDFVQATKGSTLNDSKLWNAAEIQLLFISRKYSNCLQAIAQFSKKYPQEKINLELEQIKALCLVAQQPQGKAVLTAEVTAIVFKNNKDKHFLFALGRELEFKGNIVQGIALMALCNDPKEENYAYSEMEWRGNRLPNSDYLQVFYNYFDYLDFMYSAADLQKIINQLNTPLTNHSDQFVYKQLLKDKGYLIDLLGTKYIREDQLGMACKTYKMAGDKYWQDNYNAWERGRYDDNYEFNLNPFSQFKHTEDFVTYTDDFVVNKLSVTQHLIKYLNIANNPKSKDRAYYYFIIANCYYNMTSGGNSWMMRRYSSSNYYDEKYLDQDIIDEREFRLRKKALNYYKLAMQYASSDKFKALCTRMMDYTQEEGSGSFPLLKKSYPDYYQDLSNCENLSNYFHFH